MKSRNLLSSNSSDINHSSKKCAHVGKWKTNTQKITAVIHNQLTMLIWYYQMSFNFLCRGKLYL